MSLTSPLLLAAAVLVSSVGGDGGSLAPHQQTSPIKNGIDADTCQFPSSVVMLSWDYPFCTGSLIHPRVVLFAAHCEAAYPTTHVGFGEDASSLARTVPIESCHIVPGYVNTSESVDVAFCVLQQAVTDVPIVPVMAGCEVGQMQVGDTVTIVGFGATDASFGEFGWENVVGGGRKRYTTQTIEVIDTPNNDLVLLGDNTGGCPGDSGGPMLVQLADGSWRVAGVASTVHPDAYEQTGEPCGYGTVYDMAYTQLAWIESASGYDVTPCQTASGIYDPEPGCGPFPRTPEALGGTWATGCANDDVVEAPFCSPTDFDPPIVELLAPNANVSVPDAESLELAIRISAEDADSGVAEVWVRIDGQDQVKLTEAPFEYPKVTFPVGRFTLEGVARDYAGNVGVSSSVVVSIGIEEEEEEEEEEVVEPGEDTTGDPEVEEPYEDPTDDPPPVAEGDGDGSGGCGCTSAPTTASSLLFMLGLGLVRRRRRP